MAAQRRVPYAFLSGRAFDVRRVAGVVVLVVVAVLLVVPRPVVAVSVGVSVAGLVTVDGADLESVIEEYDHVTGLLVADQARAAVLGRRVSGLVHQIGLARTALRPAVRRIYEIGTVSTLQLVIDSASTQVLADQLGLAQAQAHQLHEQITALTGALARVRAARTVLDHTIAGLARRRADLAARKRVILAALAAQAKLPPGELHAPGPLAPVPCPYVPVSGSAAVAVAVACAQIGKPYVWAATGPDTFDCSGLMVYAWGRAGVRLRHFTGWQWQDATPVSRSRLRPGDLVFFYPPTHHHVGMYIGGGWMVNAPHTGDVVREAKIDNLPIAGYRRP